MKRLLLLAACLLLLPGCEFKGIQGFKDIDKRFFVMAIGVDKGDSAAYRVTIKLAIPSPKITPGEENYQVLDQEADSVSQAIRLLKSKVDKELDFGHTKMLVFGESLAREDIREPTDWFTRRRDIQSVAYMAVGKPDAAAVVKAAPKSERLAGNALFLSFANEGTESSYIVTEYLFDFYRRLTEKGRDPYLPVIEANKEYYNINKVALLDKQKVVSILSPENTRLFNEVLRQIPKFDMTVVQDDLSFVLSIQRFKSKFIFHLRSGSSPQIIYDVKMWGVAEESRQALFDQNWDKLNQVAEQMSIQRYSSLLKEVQGLGVDPFGLGMQYRASHYQGEADWKHWQELYPTVSFQINAKIELEGTGTIK